MSELLDGWKVTPLPEADKDDVFGRYVFSARRGGKHFFDGIDRLERGVNLCFADVMVRYEQNTAMQTSATVNQLLVMVRDLAEVSRLLRGLVDLYAETIVGLMEEVDGYGEKKGGDDVFGGKVE